jgi:hypothetical protein
MTPNPTTKGMSEAEVLAVVDRAIATDEAQVAIDARLGVSSPATEAAAREMRAARSTIESTFAELAYRGALLDAGRETIKALQSELSTLRAEVEGLRKDATDEMCDSVRYLFVGMDQPGQTFGGIRKHCEMSGMDTSHWPEWIFRNDREHFNKSARAALVWHIMYRAALSQPVASRAGG